MKNIFALLLFLSSPLVFSHELENYLFLNKDNKSNQKSGLRMGPRTEGVIVIKDGKTLYEKYDRGYDQNKKHIAWSVSKTVVALLYGVALREGRIQLDQSICDFGRFENSKFCSIKIRDVLTWSTAIQWNEEYEGAAKPSESSVLAMIYGEGRIDMAGFVKKQPLVKEFKPGEIWRYSSGDSMLAAYLLQDIYKGEDLRQVFKNKIFDPIGVQDWTWESDSAGTIAGAYYFFISIRGLANIGELLLGKGTFRGKKIFDENYWNFISTVPESFKKNRVGHKTQDISGAHLWLNKAREANKAKPWPAAPDDTVAALGHWGQYLAVIPSKNAIVVRIGDTRDKSVDLRGILQRAMPLIDREGL